MSVAPVVSISSASCLETSPRRLQNIVSPEHATRSTLARASQFIRTVLRLHLALAPEQTGVSLHPGIIMPVDHAATCLKWFNLNLASLDVPDVVLPSHQVKQAISSPLDPANFAEHMGWGLINVPSAKLQDRVIQHAGSLGPSIFRTSSSCFTNGTLDRLLKSTSKAIAIERDASCHTLEEYFEIILDHHSLYPSQIRMSLDTAHTQEKSSIGTLEALEKILGNSALASLLVILELSQIHDGKPHTPLAHGEIDLAKVVELAMSSDAPIQEIVIETSPKNYSELYTYDSLVVLEKIVELLPTADQA